VSRFQVFSLSASILVAVLRLLDNLLTLIARVEFTEVSVVITLHLHVEDLRIGGRGRARDQSLLQQSDDVLAQLVEFRLNLESVPLNQVQVLGTLVLLFVLDGAAGAPRGSPGAN